MIEQIGWSLVSICHSTESPAGGRVVEDWGLIASSLQGKGQINELCILSVKNAESNKKYKFLHSAFFFYTYVSFFSLSLPQIHMCLLYFVELLVQKLVCQKSRRETR